MTTIKTIAQDSAETQGFAVTPNIGKKVQAFRLKYSKGVGSQVAGVRRFVIFYSPAE